MAQAVHCDNFDLWDSKFHRWNSLQMGPMRDMVGTWKLAALKQGMRFGVSEHLGYSRCWFQPSHGADKTGPLAGVPLRWCGLRCRARSTIQPTRSMAAVIATRPTGIASGSTGSRISWIITNRTSSTPTEAFPSARSGAVWSAFLQREHPPARGATGGGLHLQGDAELRRLHGGRVGAGRERSAMREIQPLPWQIDTSNGDWYFRDNDRYKTAAQVIRLLADIVSKNGNMLLNIVQYPDGSLPPESAELLKQLAAWMSINGEAIHGTRPWKVYGEGPTVVAGGHFKEEFPFTARDIRFTTRAAGSTPSHRGGRRRQSDDPFCGCAQLA